MLHCDDCDISLPQNLIYCPECGASGTNVIDTRDPASQGPVTPEGGDQRGFPFNFSTIGHFLPELGDDLRMAIEASLEESGPRREIGASFLQTLGKVPLDRNMSLLNCVHFSVGPLRYNAVFAEFSPGNRNQLSIRAPLVVADPPTGDVDVLRNAPDELRGCALAMERGKVSFAKKALLAQKSGAVALIVGQTYDVWPFVPQDSADEIGKSGVTLSIPILSMSRKDSELLGRLLQKSAVSDTGGAVAPVCELTSSMADPKCAVCYEEFAPGAEVFKLPCTHIFHVDCLSGWITSHNTCPLCRHSMPTRSDEREREESRRAVENSSALY